MRRPAEHRRRPDPHRAGPDASEPRHGRGPSERSGRLTRVPVAALPFQSRLMMGKWRASHSDLDSGHTSPGTFVDAAGAAALPTSARLAVESVVAASLEAGATTRIDWDAGDSAASAPVRRGRRQAQPLRDAGTAGKPQQPATTTSPTTGGRLMAFPPASTSFVLPLDFTESESLRIRLRCKNPSAGAASRIRHDLTDRLDRRVRHNSFLQKELSNCRIPHNVNNRENPSKTSSSPPLRPPTERPGGARVAISPWGKVSRAYP